MPTVGASGEQAVKEGWPNLFVRDRSSTRYTVTPKRSAEEPPGCTSTGGARPSPGGRQQARRHVAILLRP
jgi:hypothetical protein